MTLPQQLNPAHNAVEQVPDGRPERCKLVNTLFELGEVTSCFAQGLKGVPTILDTGLPLYRSSLDYLAHVFGIEIEPTCDFHYHPLFDYPSDQSYQGKGDRQNDQCR
jgi:hypothetical protein